MHDRTFSCWSIHHSSYTTRHTPLIIHHSTYTTQHTPLVIHPSSYKTHHTSLACLGPMRNSFVVFARRSTPNVGKHDFDFENTTHFACPHQLHLTFACRCPVASARRCGLVILLWHRHNPVRCCELLILQGAQTLHRWRCVCVCQKSGAHAFG